MQYLLTEAERSELTPQTRVEERNLALAAAREEILRISGFACIHTAKTIRYCDDCPCSPLKESRDYSTWDLVCQLPKSFSK